MKHLRIKGQIGLALRQAACLARRAQMLPAGTPWARWPQPKADQRKGLPRNCTLRAQLGPLRFAALRAAFALKPRGRKAFGFQQGRRRGPRASRSRPFRSGE